MLKKTIKKITSEAISGSNLTNFLMNYNENYYNLIPVKMSDKLFLSIRENDFNFDGFRIARFTDVDTARIKYDLCDEIIRKEGQFDNFKIPDIDVTSWQTVFECLKKIGKYIIVEHETMDGIDGRLELGIIEKVFKSCIYLYSFDADGVWDTSWKIPYKSITSVTFDRRYINVFSKYVQGDAPIK